MGNVTDVSVVVRQVRKNEEEEIRWQRNGTERNKQRIWELDLQTNGLKVEEGDDLKRKKEMVFCRKEAFPGKEIRL